MKHMTRILFATLALTLGSTGWGQGVFNKYAPQPGIQVSTGVDYHNTAAVSTDVTTLFGCTTPGQFLNQAGGCTVPAGVAPSGTANLVYATPNGAPGAASLRALVGADVPAINLATSGNGGVTGILLGTNGGTSNGFFSVTGPTTALRTFTFPNASATVLTTNAAVTVPQGGTGLATLTANGVLLGEGTSNISPLVMGADTVLRGTASADPVAAAVPNCGSSTTALNYNTTTHAFGCQTITGGGTPGGATTNIQFNNSGVLAGDSGLTYAGSNAALKVTGGVVLSGSVPTITPANSGIYAGGTTGGSTQLALVNSTGATNSKVWDMLAGSSTLQFRLVDDAISSAPTWLTVTRSGTTISSIAFGAPLTITAGAGGKGIDINGSSTGATNISYAAFDDSAGTRKGYVGDASSGDSDITLACDASPCNIQILPTGVGNILGPGSVSMTPSSGTFTATFNGFSGSVTRTGTYYKIGNAFCTSIGSGTGTSNSTSFTITGIPAAGTPATQVGSGVMELEDNGTLKFAYWRIPSGGTTITFSNGVNGTVFTASGTKGIDDNFTACWITS